ncbi:protein PET100 homolog, mitochondrial isoform X1 [Tupaia chinensis]|uniref:protein PET100 homolog, mitochondrial isoform X1 n=1 Tax=Tupaia chinensis TaxID=246437 RepID=UPI00070418E1|nr:protein PET100 homolog, mitochondrial isoform X1 [Tupaia chinensis]
MSCCLAAESALGGSSFVDREKRDGGEAGGVSGSEQPLPITKGNGNPSLCSCTLLFQMTLYLTFPVAMFWIANQATWFEDYVIERKRELWPPEKESQRRELEEFKERIRKQREEKLLRAAQRSS